MRSASTRVAVIVETSRGHGRQIIAGVSQYAVEHPAWSLRLEPRNIDDRPPCWLRTWTGDGIIVRCDSPSMAKAVLAADVPVVDVRGGAPEAELPLVQVDNRAIPEAAFVHFKERGFRHFAWCDLFRLQRPWVTIRRTRFLELVRESGGVHYCFQSRRTLNRGTPVSTELMAELRDWLKGLPRPVGILACDDEQAHIVLDAVLSLGMKVPADAAVLGIDNDEVFCNASSPSLSSVDVNAFTVGYEAAAMLAQLMEGRRVSAPRTVPPRGVIARTSTDIVAVDSAEIATAVRLIRERSCQGLTADNVAEAIVVSRSTLDRLLKTTIGLTATAAIMQARLDRVKADLADTELPIKTLARRAGFRSVHHLSNLFHKREGVTPGQYRRTMRR